MTTKASNAAPSPVASVRVAAHIPPAREAPGVVALGNKVVGAGTQGSFGVPPYLAAIAALILLLGPAILAAQGGGQAAKTVVYGLSRKLRAAIMIHAAWVFANANTLTADEAQTYIISTGFQVAKTGRRTQLSGAQVKNGGPGVVNFAVPNLAGRIMTFTEVSTDSGKTWTRTTDTERSSGSISALTSGQSIMVRIRMFVRKTGYTPWVEFQIVVT